MLQLFPSVAEQLSRTSWLRVPSISRMEPFSVSGAPLTLTVPVQLSAAEELDPGTAAQAWSPPPAIAPSGGRRRQPVAAPPYPTSSGPYASTARKAHNLDEVGSTGSMSATARRCGGARWTGQLGSRGSGC
nr:hypothetical protein fc93 [uncultured bacterium]